MGGGLKSVQAEVGPHCDTKEGNPRRVSRTPARSCGDLLARKAFSRLCLRNTWKETVTLTLV